MYIKVFVVADAKRESVTLRNNALEITVREPPQQNRANTRVREIVAAQFNVPFAQVRIISGYHTGAKMLSLPDADRK